MYPANLEQVNILSPWQDTDAATRYRVGGISLVILVSRPFAQKRRPVHARNV